MILRNLLKKFPQTEKTVFRFYSVKFDIINVNSDKILRRPRKPMNCFLKFVSDIRSKVLMEYSESHNIELSRKELMNIIGDRWSKLNPLEKLKYEELYTKDFEEYIVIRTLFYNNLSDEDLGVLRQIKQQRIDCRRKTIKQRRLKQLWVENKKPKHPIPPFFVFLNTKQRPKGDNRASLKPWMIDVADEFKHLCADEKRYYNEEYDKQYAEYIKKLSQWEDEMVKDGKTALLDNKKKLDIKPTEIKNLTKNENTAKKSSLCDMLSNEELENFVDVNPTVIEKMNRAWYELYSRCDIPIVKKLGQKLSDTTTIEGKSIANEWEPISNINSYVKKNDNIDGKLQDCEKGKKTRKESKTKKNDPTDISQRKTLSDRENLEYLDKAECLKYDFKEEFIPYKTERNSNLLTKANEVGKKCR